MDRLDLVGDLIRERCFSLYYAGKSWTMTGCSCHSENGLICNAIEHVFNLVHHHHESNCEQEQEFTIKCAYLESNI